LFSVQLATRSRVLASEDASESPERHVRDMGCRAGVVEDRSLGCSPVASASRPCSICLSCLDSPMAVVLLR
jgi:hypothetical protein